MVFQCWEYECPKSSSQASRVRPRMTAVMMGARASHLPAQTVGQPAEVGSSDDLEIAFLAKAPVIDGAVDPEVAALPVVALPVFRNSRAKRHPTTTVVARLAYGADFLYLCHRGRAGPHPVPRPGLPERGRDHPCAGFPPGRGCGDRRVPGARVLAAARRPAHLAVRVHLVQGPGLDRLPPAGGSRVRMVPFRGHGLLRDPGALERRGALPPLVPFRDRPEHRLHPGGGQRRGSSTTSSCPIRCCSTRSARGSIAARSSRRPPWTAR